MAGQESGEEELKRRKEEEETDRIIEQVARAIVSRGLATPAVMFLEMNKPLTFIASQSLLVAMPVLGAFVEPSKVEALSEALKSVDNVERLIRRIEDLAEEERNAGVKPGSSQ